MIFGAGRTVGALLVIGYVHEMASAAPPEQNDARFVLIVGGDLLTAEGRQPLVQAKVIHARDTLTLTISASRSANVFIAYCDGQAKQRRYGPLPVGPKETIAVPPLDVDDNAGREHLFVIAAVGSLQNSDPRLDRTLRFEDGEHACGDTLAMTTKESRSQRVNTKSDSSTQQRSLAPAGVSAQSSSSRNRPDNYPVAAGWSRVRGLKLREDEASTHIGATRATLSDDSGIAIVAFTFDHR